MAITTEFQLYSAPMGITGRVYISEVTPAFRKWMASDHVEIIRVHKFGAGRAVMFRSSQAEYERLYFKYPSTGIDNVTRTAQLLQDMQRAASAHEALVAELEQCWTDSELDTICSESVNLAAWTKQQLVDVAKRLGLKLKSSFNKRQIVQAITA